jgi:hypothetical protein
MHVCFLNCYDDLLDYYILSYLVMSFEIAIMLNSKLIIICSPANRERELGLDRRETG